MQIPYRTRRVYLEKREIQRSLTYLEKAYALYKNNNFLKHSTIHLYPALAEAYLAASAGNIDVKQMDNKQLLKKTREFCNKSLCKTETLDKLLWNVTAG